MKRNKIWAATVVGATALASVGIGSVWIQAAADQPAPSANQPTGLIVGYKSQAAEAGSDDAARQDVSAKARARGLRLDFGRRLGTGGVLVDLGGADQAALSAVMRAFQADPDVAYVEPDVRMHATAEPNDSEYTKQWHYFEDKAGMRVPGAWSSATGSGVTVAVIDTGYVKHSDLDAKIVAGYDFITSTSDSRDNNGRDSNPADEGDWQSSDGECGAGSKAHNSSWHGTHVAGTIAAATNNGKGVAGVAPDAKIQPVRVLGKCGGSLSDIADAIIWASGGTVGGISANQTPADVINLSLGGGGSCSSTYQSAINGAVQRGTTVVVAAGNSNQDVSGFQPANCDNVVAVASSNREGNRSFYSNYGNLIDVAAPGGEVRRSSDTPGTVTTPENGVWSTLNAGTTTPGAESYKPFMGTSMAAPHVAGLAALALSKKSDLTPAQVEKAIKDNARPLPGSCTGCGAGLADAAKTVASLGGDPGSTVSVTNPGDQSTVVNAAVSLQIKASSSTSGATLSYSATGLPAGLSISSSTGLISGKPTVAGTSAVKVTVTDSANATNSASFNWSVTSGQGGTVTVTKPRDQWSFKGWAIQPLQVQATSTAGGTLTFTASGLPAGLSISSSGLITGTPTGGGPHTVTVTAKDSGGGTGTTTFGWQIYGF